jgi:1-acyl-sn-glycerol-3-phosphate acyltransferase
VRRRRLGFWLRVAVTILRPPMVVLTRHDWQATENLPSTGGVVVCPNHISYVDPVAVAHFVYDNGRNPRFLAKSEIFGVPFVGRVLRGAGQIPVYRDSTNAARAYSDALAAVERGECVIVYPESTITRDPDLWPMVGKTGAARIALATGAPVVPLAQWGAQDVLAPYGKKVRLFPRKTMHLRAGPPVDLAEFRDRPLTPETLRAATEKIMSGISAELEVLRAEKAPAVRYRLRSDAGERRPGESGPAGPVNDERRPA